MKRSMYLRLTPKAIFCFFFFSLTLSAFGQKEDKIMQEGLHLYNLEKAAWLGTDELFAHFAHKTDSIGGYISYMNNDGSTTLAFSKKGDPSKILMRFCYDIKAGTLLRSDSTVSQASTLEQDLIELRLAATQLIQENQGDFFSFYENTSLNLIPIITDKEKKVYALTGPRVSGVVIIGNDYLLTFNKKNELVKKTKIHQSMIQYDVDFEKNVKVTLHSHVNSEYIDPTDICTLLLYKDYIPWEQHYVMGKKHISIFDIRKEKLIILTLKAWEKMTNRNKD